MGVVPAARPEQSKKTRMAVSLKVNGATRSVPAEPDTPLLYVLRNDLALNAAKFGCGHAQCGASTVLARVSIEFITLAVACGAAVTPGLLRCS